ncbi:MAG TPA: aldehyde dehydrogenase family protein [Candidatus Limnocylindria bacterium]|nr:aldehyde dehydrogenase family protein [Candidatus Limnocylindria bacterium]
MVKKDTRWIEAGPRPMLIGGKWRTGSTGKAFQVISPFTNEPLTTIAEASADDVDAAVRAARAAFDEGPWPRMAPNQRAEILTKIARLFERERDRFAYLEAMDMGKPISGGYMHLQQGIFAWDYFAGKARDLSEEVVRVAAGSHFNYRMHEPVGVVAEIIPWNGPAVAASQKLAAILCTGNSAVLKPSVESTLSVLVLGEILQEAGLPDGVVNIVTGPGGTVGDALLTHPGVDMVSLTGSVETGRHVMELAGSGLKRVALELGGKNPNIVFRDADLAAAAMWAVIAAFSNNGQVCVSGSRLLLETTVHDTVLASVVERVKAMKLGDPVDESTELGPLVSRAQRQRVLDYIRIGAAEGARLVYGGGVPPEPALARGNFVTPAVFDGVRAEMRIAREEIFGPILAVMQFADEAEALRLANDVEFGLAGAVWTSDIQRALRVAGRIEAGQIYVNGYYSPAMSESPAVGHKKSGVGEAGYLKYTVPKTVFVRTA